MMLRSTCKISSILSATVKCNSSTIPVRSLRHVRPQVKTGIATKIGPLEVGQLATAGGATLGLGALCYYGLGLSNAPGAIDTSAAWPQYVKQRISSTYLHLGGSLATVAATAVAAFRTPAGHRFMAWSAQRPILSCVGMIGALMSSGMVMRGLPYESSLGPKQGAWVLHNAVLGMAILPIVGVGGPIALKAAVYTAGIVGGLSAIAVCAPSDKFLNWAGPLGIGLGGVFAASLGSCFIPPTSTLGLSLFSIYLYGGLALFSCFLLYDTQKVIHKAIHHQEGQVWNGYEWTMAHRYDPINASSHLVMDIVHIFIRMAQVLMMGGGRRK